MAIGKEEKKRLEAELSKAKADLARLIDERQKLAKAEKAKGNTKRIPRSDAECALELKLYDIQLALTPEEDVLKRELLENRKKQEELKQSRHREQARIEARIAAGEKLEHRLRKGPTEEEALLVREEQTILNQMRARVSAKIKSKARQTAEADRTHRVSQIGGLVETAKMVVQTVPGGPGWSKAQFVGALMYIQNPTFMAKYAEWAVEGKKRLDEAKKESDDRKADKKAEREAAKAAKKAAKAAAKAPPE